MNNENIKIYSLNLMAYIQMRTGQIPKIHYEYDASRGSKYYGVFVDSDEVQKAINDFKSDDPLIIDLHEFISTLRDITNRKNGIKQSISVWNGKEGY